MQCNIDSRGKAVRLISGIVLTVIGGVLLVVIWAEGAGGWWWWAAAGGVTVAGLFQVYEGWCGWCVLRAMGLKTWL